MVLPGLQLDEIHGGLVEQGDGLGRHDDVDPFDRESNIVFARIIEAHAVVDRAIGVLANRNNMPSVPPCLAASRTCSAAAAVILNMRLFLPAVSTVSRWVLPLPSHWRPTKRRCLQHRQALT